jgi:prephenate dehydratase
MKDAGAIASARAGELYGLNILQNNIQVRKLLLCSFVFGIKQSSSQVKLLASCLFQVLKVGYKTIHVDD